MDSVTAIKRVDELRKQFNQRLHAMSLEIDGVAEQWEGLGRVGGQREDHAAALMARLRFHLRDISTFAKNCETQIDGMVADPFGRNAKGGAACV